MPAPARTKRKPRKDGLPFNPGSKRMLIARQREKQALQLRLQGASYDEIATKLKVTVVGAYQIVMRVLKANIEDIKEDIPTARKIETDRCDQLLGFLWKGCKRGDVRSIDSALKVAKRRAELMGLDAPVSAKVTDGDGKPIMILEAFREMIEKASKEEE